MSPEKDVIMNDSIITTSMTPNIPLRGTTKRVRIYAVATMHSTSITLY